MTRCKYYVPQVDETDCGVAALAMILKAYGSTIPLERLRQLAGTSIQGTTAFGLVETAKQFNFTVQAIQADESLFELDELTFPFIVHVIKNGELPHYYVVTGCQADLILIADPDPGVKSIAMARERFLTEWTGVCLLMAPNQNYAPVIETKRSLLKLFGLLKDQRHQIFTATFYSAFVTLLGIGTAELTQAIIDQAVHLTNYNFLMLIAGAMIITQLANALLSFGRELVVVKLNQQLAQKINLDYIKHVLSLPLNFFQTRKTGEIFSRFDDTGKIVDALAGTSISIFLDLVTALAFGVVLFTKSSGILAIACLIVPLLAGIILGFAKRYNRLLHQELEADAKLTANLIDSLRGIETIKALTLENNTYQQIDTKYQAVLTAGLKFARLELWQQSLKTLFQNLLSTFALIYGATLVMKHQLSVGELMACSTLLTYFMTTLQNLVGLQPKLQNAQVANNRLNEVLLVKPEPTAKITDLTTPFQQLQLQNVGFSHPRQDALLKSLNLTITRGEKIALVGPSGAGKSTFAKLLTNFYQPTEGQILLNQQNTINIDNQALRQLIHYLPQTPALFAGTILENLTMPYATKPSTDQIIWACQMAAIHDEIMALPAGYETILDEQATILSGGQKQRLAIARSLLSPAPVLILDESTSNLDPLTEAKITNNLIALPDRTIIFIAHRLAVAKKAERILVFANGTIVEQGSHTTLMAQKSLYHDLVTA